MIQIDSRYSGGIGRYIAELAKRLPLTQFDCQAPLFSLREQRALKKAPACDVFWSPHFVVPLGAIKAKKRVVTIHDTYHLDNKLPIHKRLYARFMYGAAMRLSDVVITVSEFSKDRLTHFFPRYSDKIRVIPNGNALHGERKKAAPYFLFVGSNKSHKNLQMLLRAQKEVGVPIVIARDISDEKLSTLYSGAAALIFPSFYEGFGLPPLEALSHGCPVIASDIPAVREVCGDHVYYINPNNPQACIEGMKKAIKGKLDAKPLSYTWESSAKRHMEVLL